MAEIDEKGKYLPLLERVPTVVVTVGVILVAAVFIVLIAGFINRNGQSKRTAAGSEIMREGSAKKAFDMGSKAVSERFATGAGAVTDVDGSKTADVNNAGMKTSDAKKKERFSIAAVGDINCGGRVGLVMAGSGVDFPFENVTKVLSAADYAFGNLECALSSRGKAVEGKEFTFRGTPESGLALKRAGFDGLSLANNHSKDFGPDALTDTIKLLDQAKIFYAGAGINSESSYRYKILENKNAAGGKQKVAFIAFSDVIPPGFAASGSTSGVASVRNASKLAGSMKEAASKAPFVVVSIHWGKELSKAPSQRQTTLAHRLIDMGADVVLGHHPHVVQGFEIYKGKLIAYSLGNFVFSPANYLGCQSALLTAEVENNEIVKAQVYPALINGVKPRILAGKQGNAWLQEVAKRSSIFKTRYQINTLNGQPVMELVLNGK
jgi:poly-gamma-glutamate synthesis protein (capsule biosynthesis protein)